MARRKSSPGARAGKSPQKQVRTSLTEGKYESGGAKIRKKKGGYVRKPKPPIRYSHRKKVVP
jgi:hypothetical protein